MSRNSIIKKYRPKIFYAFADWIEIEVKRVLALLKLPDAEQQIFSFYRNDVFDRLHPHANRALYPFLDDIATATKQEISGPQGDDFLQTFDPGGFIGSFVASFIGDYVNHYVTRHLKSSYGQINKLLTEAGPVDAVLTRLAEWREKRPEKIARNETVRGNGAMFSQVCFFFGFRVKWVLQGNVNCPWCKSLVGRSIGKGQSFLEPGDSIKVEGKELKSYGRVTHPPVH